MIIRRLQNCLDILTGKYSREETAAQADLLLEQFLMAKEERDIAREHLAIAKDGIRELKEQLKYSRKPLTLRDIQNALETAGLSYNNSSVVIVLRNLLDPESRRRAESDRLADEAIAKMMKGNQ